MSQGLSFALSVRAGTMALRPGPEITPAEGIRLVADLRNQAGKALGYVAEITGLEAAAKRAATTDVAITDRRGFVRGLNRMAQKLTEKVWAEEDWSWPATQMMSVQLGTVTRLLAFRVLGFYDPFYEAPWGNGRLLLVAPNILRQERDLNADPRDFHLWIALHEMAHAVQFAAAPWLAPWLKERLTQLLLADEEPGRVARLVAAGRRLPEVFSDDPQADVSATGLLSPAQVRILGEITATMSFLEGHADVIMDAVGPRIVKSVEELRPRFDARKVASGRFERGLRRLAGIEAKTAQYIQGAGFVRKVLAEVGHEGLNQFFSSPGALPTAAEMDQPSDWIRRVA
ncbi:MAG: zinc-dependent metalloprotease [Bifidobacteriaceae bacterium]|nr:zinc-dependent metalloprotease [Bifidobacteriaceae bacterium]